jgi:transketolase
MSQIITPQMRDSFVDKLYELAKQDNNIVLISPDMTGLNLQKFRKNLSGQFINSKAAEQNSLLIAAGLALSGKKPFVYSITPFVTTRIHEFIKLEMGVMKAPVTVVGLGAGISYVDSGPTHHALEDIGMMRAIPNIEILSPSDTVMAAAFAERTSKSKSPAYVRLDRQVVPVIYNEKDKFEDGFFELKKGDDICIVATGNMVHSALKVQEYFLKNNINIGVIDLYIIKPLNLDIINYLKKYKTIITLEEHYLNGGIGSLISEIITDNNLSLKLLRMGVKDSFIYEYGGRDNIHKKLGIDADSVIEKIKNIKNQVN